MPPVAARLPTPANPFSTVLRSMELSQSRVVMAVPAVSWAEGSAPIEVKRASQTDGDQRPCCLQVVCQHGLLAPPRQDPVGREGGSIFERSYFRAITSIYGLALAHELLEFRRLFRVPPTTANDDAFGHDLAVAYQVLADDVNVVELAILDRDEGGISDAPRLEAAEFGTPQRHRRIDRRSRDHIGERHAHAQELGHGRYLVEGWAVDAQHMDVRGDGVRIEAVGEHRPGSLEGE